MVCQSKAEGHVTASQESGAGKAGIPTSGGIPAHDTYNSQKMIFGWYGVPKRSVGTRYHPPRT